MWSMFLKGLKVIDGSQLSDVDSSIPKEFRGGNMSGDQFFELANSRVTAYLYGFSLEPVVTFGFKDQHNFTQLFEEDPQRLLQDYFNFVAAALKDNPVVVSILDGSTIRVYLENEDDFTTLAKDLFNSFVHPCGEIGIGLMQISLDFFGYKIGVTSLSDFPIVDDILKKYGVIGGQEGVNQAQFSDLLKLILQDIADALALNNITFQREYVQIANGEFVRELSEDGDYLATSLSEKVSDYIKEDLSFEDVFKNFLEENTASYKIPPFFANDEDLVHLYDVVFSDDVYKKRAIDLHKNEVGDLGKRILENFASELEAKPMLYVLYRSD